MVRSSIIVFGLMLTTIVSSGIFSSSFVATKSRHTSIFNTRKSLMVQRISLIGKYKQKRNHLMSFLEFHHCERINNRNQSSGDRVPSSRLSKANARILFMMALIISVAITTIGGIVGDNYDAYANGSINLTINNSTIAVDITGLNEAGTFNCSANSTISVTTDNASGYTLSIAANNGTNLTSGSNTLSSIESSVSEANFSNSNNTTYNNKWGYLPSKLNGATNTNFLPSPSSTGDIIDTTWEPNATANTYTLKIGARVTKTTPPGTYSNTFVINAVANSPLLTINYDGNGLYFDNDSTKTTNTAKYDANYGPVTYTEKYSHTSNISNDGTATDTYLADIATTDVVTIAEADHLGVTLYYSTQNTYDPVFVIEGEYTGTPTRNMSVTGQLGKYMGGAKNTFEDATKVDLTVTGDTVTFAFVSNASTQYYGYYAVVVGYDSNGKLINTGSDTITKTLYSKTAVNGEYKIPGHSNTNAYNFLGWSEDQNATTATYKSKSDINTKLEKVNGDSDITLYAIYKKILTINYHPNYSDATDSNQTQTIVAGTSANLKAAGDNTFTRSGYKIKAWNTKADGTGTSYASGSSYSVDNSITIGEILDLYAIWVPVYTVVYDGNGSDNGRMADVKHINVDEGDVFDLFASDYSKTGYGFAGWSLDSNAQPGGSSRIYGPNEAFTAPTHPGNDTLTLYAVWVQSAGSLQGWTGCSNMNVGDVTALTDQRDSNTYAVAKLADESCWMIENLRLENTNSDNSTGALAQGYGTSIPYGDFIGLADPEINSFSATTNPNSLYNTTNIATNSYRTHRFPRYNNANTNRKSIPGATDNRATATSAHVSSLQAPNYSYGNYYTYAAAIANIGVNASGSSTSLCPSGWKLPYGNNSAYTNGGNTKGGFYYLGDKLGATTSNETSSRSWRAYPNNFIYSGFYDNYSAYSRGSTGYYWSGTGDTSMNGYVLNLGVSSISPGTASLTRYRGSTIRCMTNS